MLLMACCFLLGSYYCYDNPAVIETQLETQFDITPTQWSLLYTVYSIPNMVLPFFGGVMLDAIGMRFGLLLFTSVLTVGQFIFALGGQKQKFWLMLLGRVVFGLGGESMSVAQSSIVSNWFKGKELAFALGLNISVSRLGSVWNSNTVPENYEDHGLGYALYFGFGICVFSLLNAFGMAALDKYGEKRDGGNKDEEEKNPEEQFKWKDVLEFKLPFWLLTISCVATYMTIFPYIQVVSDLVQKKNGIDSKTAGSMFGIPYLISAVASPILGFGIDRLGRRALFITLSSVVLVIAFCISAALPDKEGSKMEIVPLVMVGIGYSVYCAAIWGSIPYTVQPHTVGTAFGICTAIQNIGLVIAPTIVGYIKQHTHKSHGYFWVLIFFVIVNIFGFCTNFYLYVVDIKYHDGILNKVDKGEGITDLMTSPVQSRKEILRESQAKSRDRQGLVDYQLDRNSRTNLKRSMATQRPNQ